MQPYYIKPSRPKYEFFAPRKVNLEVQDDLLPMFKEPDVYEYYEMTWKEGFENPVYWDNLSSSTTEEERLSSNEFPIFLQTSITLDPNVKQYFRSVYTGFDVMGDIGGLLQFLQMVGQFLVWFTTGQQLT